MRQAESVAITRSGSARFEYAVLGIGGLLLGIEFGLTGFCRLGGSACFAARGEDRRGGANHRDDEDKGDPAGHLLAPESPARSVPRPSAAMMVVR